MTWIDLCSGLGGASAPAKRRGWRVIRVDSDPQFKPDLVADVRQCDWRCFPRKPDVLWASPPCRDFIVAALPYLLKNPRDPRTGQFFYDRSGATPTLGAGIDPDCSVVLSVLEAVRVLQPRWWIVENVAHSRRWLTPLLGPVRAIFPGHVLWGSLACLLPPVPSHKQWSDWSWGKFSSRAAERAKIPYEIGDAICRAAENLVIDARRPARRPSPRTNQLELFELQETAQIG